VGFFRIIGPAAFKDSPKCAQQIVKMTPKHKERGTRAHDYQWSPPTACMPNHCQTQTPKTSTRHIRPTPCCFLMILLCFQIFPLPSKVVRNVIPESLAFLIIYTVRFRMLLECHFFPQLIAKNATIVSCS